MSAKCNAALVVFLLACSNGAPRPDVTSGGASTSVSSASSGNGGHGGMSSVSSSGVGTGGAGGNGGALPPKPIDCAKINPGITCVEDNDCPLLSKPELDACGPWSCVWSPPPDPDAGIAGKKRCEFQPKP